MTGAQNRSEKFQCSHAQSRKQHAMLITDQKKSHVFHWKNSETIRAWPAGSHSEQWKLFWLLWILPQHYKWVTVISQPLHLNFQMQTFWGCCHTVLTDPTTQTSKCRLSGAAFHSSQTLHLKLPNADFLGLLSTPHRPYISNFQMQTFWGCFPLLTDPTSQTSKCRLSGAAATVLTDPSTQTSKCRLSVAAFHSSQTLHLKLPAADFLQLLYTSHRPDTSNFQLQTFYGCSTLLTDPRSQISSCRLSMAAQHSSQTLYLTMERLRQSSSLTRYSREL